MRVARDVLWAAHRNFLNELPTPLQGDGRFRTSFGGNWGTFASAVGITRKQWAKHYHTKTLKVRPEVALRLKVIAEDKFKDSPYKEVLRRAYIARESK